MTISSSSSTWNGLKEFADGDAALFNETHLIDGYVERSFDGDEFENEFHRLLTDDSLQLNLSSFTGEDLYSTPPDLMRYETTPNVKFEEDPLSAILNIEQLQQSQDGPKPKTRKRGRPPTIKFIPSTEYAPTPTTASKVAKSTAPEANLLHQQKLELRERRSDDDMYSPVWIRGRSVEREGLCPLCDPPRWFKIKQSAYWYHMNFYHGISAATGKPYRRPISYRMTPNGSSSSQIGTCRVEGHCGNCLQWFLLAAEFKGEGGQADLEENVSFTTWYKHAQKCHHRTKEFKIPF